MHENIGICCQKSVIWHLECSRVIFRQVFATDLADGTYKAPSAPLIVGEWEGDTVTHYPFPRCLMTAVSRSWCFWVFMLSPTCNSLSCSIMQFMSYPQHFVVSGNVILMKQARLWYRSGTQCSFAK